MHYLCSEQNDNKNMTLQTLSYIVLMIAALFDLCAMLRFDLTVLQNSEYSNKKYRNWLTDSDSLSSVKRLLPIAVLFGACTTMARISWIVVMLLAAVVIVQGVMMLRHKPAFRLTFDLRAARIYFTALGIAVIATAAGAYSGRLALAAGTAEGGALAAMLALSALPGIVMLANWLLKPVDRMIENKK